jgi:HD superfamily phosphodiesterase
MELFQLDNMVRSASEFVTDFLKEYLPSEFTYHNLTHTQEVFEAVTELGKNSGIKDDELEILQIAALFHDTGFVNGYCNHEFKSVEIARKFLLGNYYPLGKIEKISDAIIMTARTNIPVSLSDKIIRDADVLHVGKECFYSKSFALRNEWELVNNKSISETEWLQSCLDFINNTIFFTDFAKLKYEKGRLANLASLNGMIKELIAFSGGAFPNSAH